MEATLARLLQDPLLAQELRRDLAGDRTRGEGERGVSGAWADHERVVVLATLDEPAPELALSPAQSAELRLYLRPVLLVRNQLIEPSRGRTWRSTLRLAQPLLGPALPAIGRIEVVGHLRHTLVGTAWLVAPGLVATARHVAAEFATQREGRAVFRVGWDGAPMAPRIDLRGEHGVSEHAWMAVTELALLSPDDDVSPDVALLRVEPVDDAARAVRPIPLRTTPVAPEELVAVVGYPGGAESFEDPALISAMFGDVYGVKRCMPGRVMQVARGWVWHDCTTLPGSSGAALLSLVDGQAVGLHFGGRPGRANFAVPSTVLRGLVEQVGSDPS